MDDFVGGGSNVEVILMARTDLVNFRRVANFGQRQGSRRRKNQDSVIGHNYS